MSPSAEMTMLIVLGERPDAHTAVLHPQFKFRMQLYFQIYASILNNVQKIYVPF